jgi:MFS family permease
VASWVRNHSPQVIVLATLALTTAVTVVAAIMFNLWTAVAVALVAAFAQGLGKLALDAIVQREIGEEVRSSTFGVVEAFLQIAWVLGGLVGLLMSLFAGGRTGLAVMAAVLAGSLGWLLVRRRRRSDARDARVQAARSGDAPDRSSANGERHSEERIRPEAAGTTTAIVRRDDPPTEKRTRPLTNPHG